MGKKLLTIAIALVILAMVVSPAAAAVPLPGKSPLPPNSPWNTVWNLVTGLQAQITALNAKVDDIPDIVVAKGTLGISSDSDKVYPPTGFTTDDCSIMLRPNHIATVYRTGSESNPPECSYHISDIAYQAWTFHTITEYWWVDHRQEYEVDANNPEECPPRQVIWNGVSYLIVCTKS